MWTVRVRGEVCGTAATEERARRVFAHFLRERPKQVYGFDLHNPAGDLVATETSKLVREVAKHKNRKE